MITHEHGYNRVSSAPIIAPGALAQWDDYFIYACAVTRVDGVLHMLYGGARNVGANPRAEIEVGLATSSDGLTWTKQGKVIPKSAVAPANGFAPFSILQIDGVWHLFGAVLQNASPTYRAAYFTSSDLTTWSGPTFMTGLAAQSHGPCVIEDPADNEKLILFYSDMDDGPSTYRATATKTDPSTWSNNAQVSSYTSIYPSVRWIGDRFEMFVAKPVDPAISTLQGYTIHKTASVDGLSFPEPSKWSAVIPRGTSSAFDYRYTTTPFLFEDRFFYSGRPADNLGYRGIGCAKLEPIGGTIEWDWTAAAVGPWPIAKTGSYGIRLAAGNKGRPAVFSHGVGRDKAYEVWIYDDMTNVANFQNTFRLTDKVSGGNIVVGTYPGASTSSYIYRLSGSGAWVASSVPRSLGWHKLTYEVGDDVVVKIDGVTVATDSAFDTASPFTLSVHGYDSGTSYLDDYTVSDL